MILTYIVDKNGKSVLHEAVFEGYFDLVRYFAEDKAQSHIAR